MERSTLEQQLPGQEDIFGYQKLWTSSTGYKWLWFLWLSFRHSSHMAKHSQLLIRICHKTFYACCYVYATSKQHSNLKVKYRKPFLLNIHFITLNTLLLVLEYRKCSLSLTYCFLNRKHCLNFDLVFKLTSAGDSFDIVLKNCY